MLSSKPTSEAWMIPNSEHSSKSAVAIPLSDLSERTQGLILDLDQPVLDRPMLLRPEKAVSIEFAEANFRPLIEATRHMWPSPEARLKAKNLKPLVMH